MTAVGIDRPPDVDQSAVADALAVIKRDFAGPGRRSAGMSRCRDSAPAGKEATAVSSVEEAVKGRRGCCGLHTCAVTYT